MLTEGIIKNIENILKLVSDFGNTSYLTMSLSSFNSVLYQSVLAIMQYAVLPVSYLILGLCFLFELFQISTKFEQYSSHMAVVGIVFRSFFKIAFFKFILDNSSNLLTIIYNETLEIILKISTLLSPQALPEFDKVELINHVKSLSLGEQFSYMMSTSINGFIIQIIFFCVNIIIIGRFIELYLYIAVSPIPISTLLSDSLKSIGISFLKNFAALSIQGVIIYIILSFFPIIASSITRDNSTEGLLFMSMILAIAIFSSSKYAKNIINSF